MYVVFQDSKWGTLHASLMEANLSYDPVAKIIQSPRTPRRLSGPYQCQK